MISRLGLLRHASPLLVGRLASAAVTFVLPLWLARLLDPAGYGTYKQLFLVAQTILLAGQLGLTQSLYFFLPRGGPGRGAYVTQALLGLAGVGLLVAAGLWLATPWLGVHLGGGGAVTLAELRVPMVALAAGLLVGAPLEAALTSEGRVATAAATYVVSDGVRAALLLGGALRGGVVGLAWGGAIYGALRLLGLALVVGAGALPTARPTRAALRAQLGHALPLAGAVWLYVAQRQFAQYTVAARFDAATFALFSVAAFHLPVVDILYTPITEVLMLRLGRGSAGDAAAARAEWHDAIEKLASLLWPATACALLFGPTVLPLLFGDRYGGSVPLFLVATLEIPLWVLPVDALLRAAGDTRFLFAWYGGRAAITAALVLAGVHFLGLTGAIVGVVVSEAISRVVLLGRGRRHLGSPAARQLIDGPGLSRVAAATALAVVPAALIQAGLGGRGGFVAGALAYGVTYIALRLAFSRAPVIAAAVEPRG